MEIMALIPARSGSVRVENKNIRNLAGKPLISYTIRAAKASRKVNRIVVSTDSESIAGIAREHGAEIPFLRPREISKTDSTEMEFFLHALGWFKKNENYSPDFIVLLYPTSPFRKAKSIDLAVEMILARPDADSLRSVRLCSEHPYKMWRIEGDKLVPFVGGIDCNMHTWSYQKLPIVYTQNASIYITRPRTIFDKGSPTGDIILPFVMNERESVDINSLIDFEFAEWLISNGDI